MIKLKDILNEDEPKKEKETAEKEPAKTLTSVDFIDSKTRDKIYGVSKNVRPDLKKKVLGLNFDDFLKKFDDGMLKYAAGETEEKQDVQKIGNQVQSVSLAKHSIFNTFKLEAPVKNAGLEYYKNSKEINSLLRTGIISDKKLSAVIKTLDEYFKSDDSRLRYTATVYRGVSDLKVFKELAKIGSWQELGFMSTSLNPLISQKFAEGGSVAESMRTPVFKIILKPGTPVLMVSCSDDPFCTDTEITLPRGCKLTVVSQNKEMNIYTLSVEIPNA